MTPTKEQMDRLIRELAAAVMKVSPDSELYEIIRKWYAELQKDK